VSGPVIVLHARIIAQPQCFLSRNKHDGVAGQSVAAISHRIRILELSPFRYANVVA
jgi:hypothetical protein